MLIRQRVEKELLEREQKKKKGVKSSESRSRCFGEKDIKDEGRCCGRGGGDGGVEAEIAEKKRDIR